MTIPPNIDQMTPREAWQDGHRAGREELAAEMQRDSLAAAASESPAGVKATADRIAAVEKRLTQVENEQRDNAGLVVRLGERVTRLEGGKVE